MSDRRSFLRGAVAASVAGAAGAIATPVAAADPDRALTLLVEELFSIDERIEALVARYSSAEIDCDQMPGFDALNARWMEVIDAIVATKATSLHGIRTKVHALRSRDLCQCGFDDDIAISLGRDLIAFFPPLPIGGLT